MADLTTNGDDHDCEAHGNDFSFSKNVFGANVVAAAGTDGGGEGALLSGMRRTTRSVLPLWSKAGLRFQWELCVPPEIKATLAGDGYERKARSLAISKLPLLKRAAGAEEVVTGATARKGCLRQTGGYADEAKKVTFVVKNGMVRRLRSCVISSPVVAKTTGKSAQAITDYAAGDGVFVEVGADVPVKLSGGIRWALMSM